MPKRDLNHFFSLLLFTLFTGTFYVRLQQALLPQAAAAFPVLLFALPLIVYGAQRRLFPASPERAETHNNRMGRLAIYAAFLIALAALAAFLHPGATVLAVPETVALWAGMQPLLVIHLTFSGLFIIFLSLAFITAAILSFAKRRNSILVPLLITTLFFMLLFSYSDRGWSYLFPLHIGSGLLFQAYLQQNLNRRIWLGLLLAVSFTIGLAVPSFTGIWFQATAQNPVASAGPETLFFWNNTSPGRPINPSDQPLFYVQSSTLHYWRSEVYDTYNGNSWKNNGTPNWVSQSSPFLFDPINLQDQRGTSSPPSVEAEIESEVKTLLPLAKGVGLPLPLSSRSVTLKKNDGTFYRSAYWEVIMLPSILKKGQFYSAASDPIAYNADDLRQIPALPNWDRIPGYQPFSNIPFGAHYLAQNITRSATNPYDKIMALVDYLQQNETYTLHPVIYPESNADFVSAFLFNTHEGYCVQFSSSLVLLAQSLGYPARWVVGFNSGEPLPAGTGNPFPGQPRSTVRVLTQADAHSWAEVYFPGYGWVPFEATPGFSGFVSESAPATASSGENPALPLPSSPNQNQPPKDITSSGQASPSASSPASSSWVKGLGLALAFLLLLLLIVFLGLRKRRLEHPRAGSDRELIQFLYVYWRKKLVLLQIGYDSSVSIREHACRLSRLGSDWLSAWTELSRLAEEACYAETLPPKSVTRLYAVLSSIQTLYRRSCKALPYRTRLKNGILYPLLLLPFPKALQGRLFD